MSSLVSIKGGWPNFSFVSVIDGTQRQETTSILVYDYSKYAYVLVASEAFGRSFSHVLSKYGTFNNKFKDIPVGWGLPQGQSPVGFTPHTQDGRVSGWRFDKKDETMVFGMLADIVAGKIQPQQATTYKKKSPERAQLPQMNVQQVHLPFNVIPSGSIQNITPGVYNSQSDTSQQIVPGIPVESKEEVTHTLIIMQNQSDSIFLIPNNSIDDNDRKMLDAISELGQENSDKEMYNKFCWLTGAKGETVEPPSDFSPKWEIYKVEPKTIREKITTTYFIGN